MSDPSSTDIRQSVFNQQLVLLYRSSAGAIWATSGFVVFTIIALWGVASQSGLLLWGSMQLVLALVRLVWMWAYKRDPRRYSVQTWMNLFLVLMFCNGLFWGSLLLLYSISWPLPYQFMTWIVYPAVIAGSVMIVSSYYPAFVTFVMPIILCCCWVLLNIHGSDYGLLLLIMSVFFVCVLMMAKRSNATLIEAIEARMRLQEANAKLAQMATQDVLTGVSNRRALAYQLQREWGSAIRQQKSIALLMVDVDHFKAFNDRFGHSMGDKCLKIVAQVIADQLHRSTDLVSRYGGEEFALLLADTDPQGAVNIANGILDAVRRIRIPGLQEQGGKVITVSIGVSCYTPQRGELSDELLEQADKALYRAKGAGRDRIEVF